jgi:prophage antirepressor-like protein
MENIMSNVIPFKFKTTEVRTLEINDLIWFVASDVAKALEYSAAKDMTRMLDEDERGGHIVPTPSGDQEMTIINESGLYHAILKSRKPEAQPFRKWITTEVLPAIRKTGRYDATAEPKAEPKPKTKPKALPNGLTVDQQDAIKSLVKSRVSSLPQDKQAKAAITCWSALKSKFGKSYKEIEPEQFTDAVSLIARVVLEGDYIPAGETPAQPKPAVQTVTATQVQQIRERLRFAFAGWVFSRDESQKLLNRIRAENNIEQIEDLPADRLLPVLELIEVAKKTNLQFNGLMVDLKNWYLKEYIGAGAPWTPSLKRKLRERFGEELPERPNWREIESRLSA